MEQFEDFYVAWYARSKRFACEYVGDEDAEDVVQNVFIHLYERQHLFKTCTNLKAYLFISIKNKCLDILARRVMESTDRTVCMQMLGELWNVKILLPFNRNVNWNYE